ncbi:MAG: L-threonylcarbamoyladenylate synthase [Gammaproteobacteria bacterium]
MEQPSKRSTQLDEIARTIHRGGVVAYPTEGVYGLGCDPTNKHAVLRILHIKERPVEKGLILIAADFAQLQPWVEPMELGLQNRVLDCWPGPVTWLLPARRGVPVWLRGAHLSLAVRVTDHPLAAALCREVGYPLVSTSANRSGQEPARTAEAVESTLGSQVDGILDGPVGSLSGATEIRDAYTGRVIRSQLDISS